MVVKMRLPLRAAWDQQANKPRKRLSRLYSLF
jgi:hypothetical protein